MIITGAKGMAKELLEVMSIEYGLKDNEIVFFDNVNQSENRLYNRFTILKTFEEAREYIENVDAQFTLGLGNPKLRRYMANKFIELGGKLTTIISTHAKTGSFNTTIEEGTQIMEGVIITNDVSIGKGVLINTNTTINHDTLIGDFTEIATNVSIAGRCTIGENVFIGSNATVIPDICIGDNAVIGAGAVVISDIPANTKAVGNPARIL